MISLPVANLAEAKFECIFGRGCDGICCQNGRPPLSPTDQARIDPILKDKILPELRPEARKTIEKMGYLSGRKKIGMPTLRVTQGWCVFFKEGCVLHKIGAREGDPYRYKPELCALFPLEKDEETGEWFVRQKGYNGEFWDLFCLDPAISKKPAAESLKDELAYAERLEAAQSQPPLSDAS